MYKQLKPISLFLVVARIGSKFILSVLNFARQRLNPFKVLALVSLFVKVFLAIAPLKLLKSCRAQSGKAYPALEEAMRLAMNLSHCPLLDSHQTIGKMVVCHLCDRFQTSGYQISATVLVSSHLSVPQVWTDSAQQ